MQSKNQFDERKQEVWVERIMAIQVDPLFLLLDQEEEKRRLSSQ